MTYNTLLERKITEKTASVGIIGLGYVGLPLAIAANQKGIMITGFDVSSKKLESLRLGESYVEAVSPDDLNSAFATERFNVTDDFTILSRCDVIIICVPTPLSKYRTPDLSYVEQALEQIACHVTPGTMVILESTTYPGTTDEIMVPILSKSGLTIGTDLFVAFSPEREDPGNGSFNTKTIPKIVAGTTPVTTELAAAFYSQFLTEVISVASPAVAEAAKITENVFRAVNIALVNELKTIFDRMGIDVWDVVDAAATKPFGYMPFYPGPGLGGHCIPVDPFYLSWKAREYGMTAQFIELAGEVNVQMPEYVIGRLRDVLDRSCHVSLSQSRLLAVGASYKKNVSDIRESPAMDIMARLDKAGAFLKCLDPHVAVLDGFQVETPLQGNPTIEQTDVVGEDFDAILILTDHDNINYSALHSLGLPIIDTRNAMARRGFTENVYKA